MQLSSVQVTLCLGVPVKLSDYVKLAGLDKTRSEFSNLSDEEFYESVYYTDIYDKQLSIPTADSVWTSDVLKLYKFVDENYPSECCGDDCECVSDDEDNGEEDTGEVEQEYSQFQDYSEPESTNDYIIGITIPSGLTMNQLMDHQQIIKRELLILQELVPGAANMLNVEAPNGTNFNNIIFAPLMVYNYNDPEDDDKDLDDLSDEVDADDVENYVNDDEDDEDTNTEEDDDEDEDSSRCNNCC